MRGLVKRRQINMISPIKHIIPAMPPTITAISCFCGAVMMRS